MTESISSVGGGIDDMRLQQPETSVPEFSLHWQDIHIDILSQIFTSSLPCINIGPPSLNSAPLNISHVCRSWRDVALSTPQLWTQVYFSTTYSRRRQQDLLEYCDTALDRSRCSPLDLCLHISGDCVDRPYKQFDSAQLDSVIRDFVERTLTRELYRWRMVDFNVPLPIISMRSLCWDEATRTATIKVPAGTEELSQQISQWWTPSGHDNDEGGSGSGGQEVKLCLDISKCSRLRRLVWSSPCPKLLFDEKFQYSTLTSLRFDDCGGITPEQYFALLSATPALEELKGLLPYYTTSFPDYLYGSASHSGRLSPEVTSLPSLREMYLEATVDRRIQSVIAGATLFEHLLVPSLLDLKLCTIKREDEESMYEDGLHMLFGRSLYKMIQRSSPPLISFTLCSKIPETLLVDILRLVPSLERVEFDEGAVILDHMMDEMSSSEDTLPESQRTSSDCLCPRLKAIQVYAGSLTDADGVARMLLSRVRACASAEVDAGGRNSESEKRTNFRTLECAKFREGMTNLGELLQRSDIKYLKTHGLDLEIT